MAKETGKKSSGAAASTATSTATAAAPAAGGNDGGEKKAAVTIGPKRKLAFAVVGLISVLTSLVESGKITQEDLDASAEFGAAKTALTETGYGDLKPRGQRIADLQKGISEAAAKGDSATVLKLGKELKNAQDGRV